MSIPEFQEMIWAQPEVTKSQAMAALISQNDAVEAGDHEAIARLMEISGAAATSDNPEFLRRFIVFVCEHGPIAGKYI